MKEKINKQKVTAVVKTFDGWIKTHVTYILPCPNFLKKTISTPYHRWYCGITKFNDTTRLEQHLLKQEWAGLYFKIIAVGTRDQANLVEAHFSSLGIKNNANKAGSKPDSTYAYVFKADANIAVKVFLFFGKE